MFLFFEWPPCRPHPTLQCSSTQQEADEVFADLEAGKEASYIGTMAKTLKSIHTAVKENQVVITEAFGPAHVLDLVKDVSLALDEKVCPQSGARRVPVYRLWNSHDPNSHEFHVHTGTPPCRATHSDFKFALYADS